VPDQVATNRLNRDLERFRAAIDLARDYYYGLKDNW
jgi:hypothetical protein